MGLLRKRERKKSKEKSSLENDPEVTGNRGLKPRRQSLESCPNKEDKLTDPKGPEKQFQGSNKFERRS